MIDLEEKDPSKIAEYFFYFCLAFACALGAVLMAIVFKIPEVTSSQPGAVQQGMALGLLAVGLTVAELFTLKLFTKNMRLSINSKRISTQDSEQLQKDNPDIHDSKSE